MINLQSADFNSLETYTPALSSIDDWQPTKKGPFARVPAAAISDRHVSATELRVIAAIARYADKNGFCYPSVGRLAEDLGRTRTAVQKQIKKAAGHGYLEVERRTKPTGEHTSNMYRVIFPALIESDNQATHAPSWGGSSHPSDNTDESASSDWVVF